MTTVTKEQIQVDEERLLDLIFPRRNDHGASGAPTKDEFRGSVLSVWRALQLEMRGKVADRVRRNAEKVVELNPPPGNGGNLYQE